MNASALLCWRRGILPSLSTAALLALKDALERDDPALLQRETTSPLPLSAVQDCPVRGACAVAYAVWKGEALRTVGQVETRFAEICRETDARLGEPGGFKWFLHAWDDLPRAQARETLLAEVIVDLIARGFALPGNHTAA